MKKETVACCLVDFGCLSEIPYDNLHEHYYSKIHQDCLMKAIESYVRQLHVAPKSSPNKVGYFDIVDCVGMLAENISSLHDDYVQIHRNVLQLHNHLSKQQSQIEQLKDSIEESSKFIDATQININALQTEIDTLQQTAMDLSFQLSSDGSFIWRITDVAQKINDAISERQISVYSPPFFSSPTGYKMCMRLYFNGDGLARRTHLSLFFVLLQGDYDALLTWPFSYKISFCLYDLTNAKRHLVDSFRPNIKSSSFQRPQSSMNIASGIPKFCPLHIIQQDNSPYVRNDCMFIRCIVDFVPTQKTVLPYIFGLNVGLPQTVQQTMIQAEIERCKSMKESQSMSDEN